MIEHFAGVVLIVSTRSCGLRRVRCKSDCRFQNY